MTIELTVIAKDEERTLKKSWVVYEDLTLSDENPLLRAYIRDCLEEFDGEPDDVKVKVLMVIR